MISFKGFSIVVVWVFFSSFYLGFGLGVFWIQDITHEAAIERGFALRCPETGDFAWKGECEQ